MVDELYKLLIFIIDLMPVHFYPTTSLTLCLFPCRCWRWRLLPASLPALSSYRSDQCGWHRSLLCPGRHPLLSLSGLLQKCRLLHWPVAERDRSTQTLVCSRVIAAYGLFFIVEPETLSFITAGSSGPLRLPGTVFREVMAPGSYCSPCRYVQQVAIMLPKHLNPMFLAFVSLLYCIFKAPSIQSQGSA